MSDYFVINENDLSQFHMEIENKVQEGYLVIASNAYSFENQIWYYAMMEHKD